MIELFPSSADRWFSCPPSAKEQSNYKKTGETAKMKTAKGSIEDLADIDIDFTGEGRIAHKVAEMLLTQKSPDFSTVKGVTAEMIGVAEKYKKFIYGLEPLKGTAIAIEKEIEIKGIAGVNKGRVDCILYNYTAKRLHIIDFKYGAGEKIEAEENKQLLIYAIGTVKWLGLGEDTKIVLHIFQPRAKNVKSWELSGAELKIWETELNRKGMQAITGTGVYKPGKYCGNCTALTECSVLKNFIESKVEFLDPTTAKNTEIAETLELMETYRKWANNMEEEAKKRLEKGEEIAGYELKAGGTAKRRWADEEQALKKLVAAGYREEDLTTTKLKTPKQIADKIGDMELYNIAGGLIGATKSHPKVVRIID